jgi:hypothetical protein
VRSEAACTLLTRAEVEAAVGKAVADNRLTRGTEEPFDTCYWSGSDRQATALASLRLYRHGVSRRQLGAFAEKLGGTSEIAGLGDEAFSRVTSDGALVVFLVGTTECDISVPPRGQIDAGRTLEQAVALARIVAGRL